MHKHSYNKHKRISLTNQTIKNKTHYTHNILHQSFEDGPDRGFRNVGKTESDAGGKGNTQNTLNSAVAFRQIKK
jgi:hypothetical protein